MFPSPSGAPRDRRGKHRRPEPQRPGRGLPRVRPRIPGEALMSGSAWAQLVALIVLVAISTPLLGSYLAKVYSNKKAPGDRIFHPIERLVYRVCGVNEESEQRW